MAFEFTPSTTRPTEAFWRLTLSGGAQTHTFLLAGTVAEPRVSLERPSLQFRQQLVGSAASPEVVHLVNAEAVAFPFEVTGLAAVLEAAGLDLGALKVTPMSGVIPPNASLPLELAFSPPREGAFNLNVTVTVARKSMPLTLNVKGEGYGLHDRLTLSEGGSAAGASADAGAGGTGQGVDLAPSGVNFLDFGAVPVQEKSVRRITLSNGGSWAFDFA